MSITFKQFINRCYEAGVKDNMELDYIDIPVEYIDQLEVTLPAKNHKLIIDYDMDGV